MSIIKILHLHTDPKFIQDTLKYIDDRVQNTILFLGEQSTEVTNKLEALGCNFIILNPKNTDILQILSIVQEYKHVVLNEFCTIKREILNKANTEVNFYLRLFGYELYGYQLYKYLHKTSIHLSYPITFNKNQPIKFFKKKIKRWLKLDLDKDKSKINADLNKLAGIILVSHEEYTELKQNYKLPKFIQLPLTNSQNNICIDKKDNTIILGNSKHYWNNHLEVIRPIIHLKPKMFLFYSYGPNNLYTQTIENLVKSNPNTILQTDFVDIKEFYNIYSKASAVVINSYRQHALGNIITGIFSGCKIYLNPKSATYKWLVNHNFKIESVYNLKNDIQKDNLNLVDRDRMHNINSYLKIQQEYTIQNFISNIINN